MDYYEKWVQHICFTNAYSSEVVRKVFPTIEAAYEHQYSARPLSQAAKAKFALLPKRTKRAYTTVQSEQWLTPYARGSTFSGFIKKGILVSYKPNGFSSVSLAGATSVNDDNYKDWVKSHFLALQQILAEKPETQAAVFMLNRLPEHVDPHSEVVKNLTPLNLIEFPIDRDYPACLKKKSRRAFTKLVAEANFTHSQGLVDDLDLLEEYIREIINEWRYHLYDLNHLVNELTLAFYANELFALYFYENGLPVAINFARLNCRDRIVDDLHLLKYKGFGDFRMSDYAVIKNLQALRVTLEDPECWVYSLDDTMTGDYFPESPNLRYKYKFLPSDCVPVTTKNFGTAFILFKSKEVQSSATQLIIQSYPTLFTLPHFSTTCEEL